MSTMTDLTLDDLCKRLGMTAADAPGRPELEAEFNRRNYLAQMEVIAAQRDAAESAKKNANYMLWSVFAASVSAIITALGVAFNAFAHHN
jgi:hypothetical protein